MAQQDKTDWYWNGVLAGAVNNLYYDLINVDVVHTPYSTTNRNSSFFLQTRRNYAPSDKWDHTAVTTHRDWDVTDVKYVWDKSCEKTTWRVYVMLSNKSRSKIRIHVARIEDWCVQEFDRWKKREYDSTGCGNFKFFTTWYVKWNEKTPWDIILLKDEDVDDCWDYEWDLSIPEYSGIQINKYDWWTTYWLFSDEVVESWDGRFRWPWEWTECPEKWISIGDYILVYSSLNGNNDWFAGQVRMVTWVEWKRLTVDAPWDWFKTLEWDGDEVKWKNVKYKIFSDRWEIVGFTAWKKVYMLNAYINWNDYQVSRTEVYDQSGLIPTHIISIADVADKMYVLTDNGFVHFSKDVWYNKFFIQDDAFVWADKLALASYRNVLLAFWDSRIAVWIPDENNTYTTLYDQSTTVWLWSRYSFAEYDWDLLFISNDKRLLAISIAQNVWRYMLQYEDLWDAITSKLAILTYWDEVFLGNDGNDLKIFINTKSRPYYNEDWDWQAFLTWATTEQIYKQENTMTRIIKYNKQFRVWTEDWIQWILLQGIDWWVYFGEWWLYQRGRWDYDYKGNLDMDRYAFKTYISAYLIENESDWVWWTNSWLASRPKLYNLSKLNRLITTLWPWEYSHESKIKVTSYIQGLWRIQEFSIDWDNNERLWLITSKYLWQTPDKEDMKRLECLTSTIPDNQKAYQPTCVWSPNAAIQNLPQQQPRCDNFSEEILTYDKWVCIDDSLYELAPTMPLTTNLWESQDYATQIKLELVWWVGDIITFGGWLWEMFVAPLFTTWPDWEYQLQPNTDC